MPQMRRMRVGQAIRAPRRRRTALTTLDRRRRGNVGRNLAEHSRRENDAFLEMIRRARARGLAIILDVQRLQDVDWRVKRELGLEAAA